MQLSDKLINYLYSTKLPHSLRQNFLLTDLKKIIFTATFDFNEHFYNNNLSNDLLSLIDKWNNMPYSDDLYIIENNNVKPIVQNDDIHYSAQLIFPIFQNNLLVGLAIFFRNTGDYVKSSSKAPNTIRKWIMFYLDNNI